MSAVSSLAASGQRFSNSALSGKRSGCTPTANLLPDSFFSRWQSSGQAVTPKIFQAEFKNQIENTWNNNPFVLVSKDGAKQYIPQVKISFVKKFTNTSHKFILEAHSDPLQGTAEAFTVGNTMTASLAAMHA